MLTVSYEDMVELNRRLKLAELQIRLMKETLDTIAKNVGVIDEDGDELVHAINKRVKLIEGLLDIKENSFLTQAGRCVQMEVLLDNFTKK